MKGLILLLSLFALSAQAAPRKVVAWYLGEPKVAALKEFIFLAHLAQNDSPYECLPMGDGCFHPQLGFIPTKPTVLKDLKENKEDLKVKTFNSLDVDMVECDKKQGFDIFCGKEKKEIARGGDTEIWVDTSSSMKRVDFNANPDYCGRREMVDFVFDHCPKNTVDVFVYDTSKKEMGTSSGTCQNFGMNDDKRLVDWIKNSEAKKLFIISDLEEYTPVTREYLDSIGAEVKGVDTTLLTGKDLMKLAEQIVKACK